MSDRDKRITRLERKPGRKPKVVYVWRDVLIGESNEEAIARHFPQGPPTDASLVILHWQE